MTGSDISPGGWLPRAGTRHRRSWRGLLLGLGAVAVLGVTGCQVEVGGLTLPSPYYMSGQVQYYPPGPEFKLSREAAAQKAFNQEDAARQR